MVTRVEIEREQAWAAYASERMPQREDRDLLRDIITLSSRVGRPGYESLGTPAEALRRIETLARQLDVRRIAREPVQS